MIQFASATGYVAVPKPPLSLSRMKPARVVVENGVSGVRSGVATGGWGIRPNTYLVVPTATPTPLSGSQVPLAR